MNEVVTMKDENDSRQTVKSINSPFPLPHSPLKKSFQDFSNPGELLPRDLKCIDFLVDFARQLWFLPSLLGKAHPTKHLF
jgi:hypothetical protein